MRHNKVTEVTFRPEAVRVSIISLTTMYYLSMGILYIVTVNKLLGNNVECIKYFKTLDGGMEGLSEGRRDGRI